MRNAKHGGALIYDLFGLRTNNGINKMERCCVGRSSGGEEEGKKVKLESKNQKI